MLVTRYLFKNLFSATVFVALTLTLVIWLTQSLKLLELVANSDAPPGMFIHLVFLTLPKFLEVILPLSLVIALLFTYNKLIMDNEIVVLRACGVDQFALARPAVLLALGISLFLMVVSAWITPLCVTKVQSMRQTIKTQYSAFLLRDGIFNTFGKDLTIYLRARDGNGDMRGLVIHDARDKDKPPVTVTAKKGRIEMNGDIPNIVVFDGIRQQIDLKTSALSKLYFQRYTIEIKGLEGTAETRWREPSERTLPELFTPDLTNKRDRASAELFRAEIHRRLVTPWNALAFTISALAVLLLGPFNRRGQHVKIIMATVAILLTQVLSLAFVNVTKRHLGAAPLIYLNTLLPVLLGFFFLHMKGEQALMRALRRWNTRHMKAVSA